MGNIVPFLTAPTEPTISSNAAAAPATDDRPNLSYKGKKYEPSQHQVDFLYGTLAESLKLLLGMWYGVDMRKLLVKLFARILENQPQFFAVLEEAMATAKTTTTTTAKVKIAPAIRMDQQGPIVFGDLPSLPIEVIARIVSFCDRSGVNNIGRTCKNLYRVVEDRNLVTSKPWPSRGCQYPRPAWNSHELGDFWDGYCFFATNGLSRFAVVRTVKKMEEDEWYHVLEIWDRFHGLIGEIECSHPVEFDRHPAQVVFSPDGDLLLVQHKVRRQRLFDDDVPHEIVIQAVQLPPVGADAVDMGPIIVSEHRLHDTRSAAVHLAFVNNTKLAALAPLPLQDAHTDQDYDVEFWKGEFWKVESLTEGNLGLSHSPEMDFRIPGLGNKDKFASRGTFLACALNRPFPSRIEPDVRIIFYDLDKMEYILSQPLLEGAGAGSHVDDLAFSKNGKLVVFVAEMDGLRDERSKLFVLDCNVDAVEQIGEPRNIPIGEQSEQCNVCIMSFSADGEKILVKCEGNANGEHGSHTLLIDLETEVVENVLDHLAWDAIAN